MKKFAALFLTAILIFSLSFGVMAAPEGTPISSLEGLKSLEGASGKKFYLTNDIVLSKNSEFTPIKKFNGTLDGNGKKIINLTVKSDSVNVGLFETIEISGTVKNLTLENVNIECNSNSTVVRVGAIAGKNSGAIKNCRVSGKISVNAVSKYSSACVGGIVGVSEGQIECLENYANISVKAGGVSVGGIVGRYNSRSLDSLGQCINHGNINAEGLKLDKNYAGGIVGESNWSVINCANYGTVFVKSDIDSYSAGVAGILTKKEANVSKSFNGGKIRCEAATKCFWDAIVAQSSNDVNFGCFYLEGSVAGKGTTDITTAESLSSSEATQQKAFTTFDFNGIWKIADGKLTLQNLTAAKPTVIPSSSQEGTNSQGTTGTTSSNTSGTTSGNTSGTTSSNTSGTTSSNTSGTTSGNNSGTVSSETTPEDEYIPPVDLNGITNDGTGETNSKPTFSDDFTPKKALPFWIFGVIAVAAVAGVCVFLYNYKKKN